MAPETMQKLASVSTSYVLASSLLLACGGSPPPQASSPSEPPKPAAVDQTPIADPVANVPPTCKGGTKPAAEGLIDDLEDGNAEAAPLAGRDGSWWLSKADHATISIPAGGKAKPSAGGAADSKHGMHFVGKTDNSDPWGAAVGVNFLKSGFYDASKYAGIAFKIKSAKPNLDVRLKVLDSNTHPDGGKCTKQCFNGFGRELILGTEWKEVKLMWSELTQQSDWGDPRPPMIDATKIKDIEWNVWPGNDFDLWIDDVHFLACE